MIKAQRYELELGGGEEGHGSVNVKQSTLLERLKEEFPDVGYRNIVRTSAYIDYFAFSIVAAHISSTDVDTMELLLAEVFKNWYMASIRVEPNEISVLVYRRVALTTMETRAPQ